MCSYILEKENSMLSRREKRIIESELIVTINANPSGINTRVLIATVMRSISNTVPNANCHHLSGMLSWIGRNNGFNFLIRTPGYSVIAA